MKVAYIDCSSGASGDMILAALIDGGAELEAVTKQISRIDFGPPVELTVAMVTKSGLRAAQLHIEGAGDARVESIGESIAKVRHAHLDSEVEAGAIGVLERLGAAEAKVHGVGVDEVHLHEIGDADTIVDAVGVAAAFASLGIDRVYSSPVATGTGTVTTRHGVLGVPAPAVLELLNGAEIYGRGVAAELVTPTGAAILAQYASSFGEMPPFIVESQGYGAGRADLPFPNVLRVIIGSVPAEQSIQSRDVLIEANIDDMNPEIYEYVIERLFEAGADDAWIVPAIGKRGRPASIVSILTSREREPAVREVLLEETSSIGVRTSPVTKWALDREWTSVDVEGHTVRVKIARKAGKILNIAPEYADCAEAARRTGLPLKEVFRRASAAAIG